MCGDVSLATEDAFQDILERLREIDGVDVVETENDDEVKLVGDTIQPYIIVMFGGPVRAARGRGIGPSANDVNVLWVNTYCVSGNPSISRQIKDAVVGKLVDFYPTDSGRLTVDGGQQFDWASTTTLPKRYVSVATFTFRHNLQNVVN